MGNSEVGHLNLGAGRIVYQPLTRVSKSIEDGDFFRIPALTGAMDHAREHNAALHLLGLCPTAGCIPTSTICWRWCAWAATRA
jgi:2,3-bisphosphoglycerate-independent phosphoglycerate mutase